MSQYYGSIRSKLRASTVAGLRSRSKETGFVSIFTVLLIMSVLTLVTIGFSNVTRNAERRSLDNQLNTQAFYSAESGINDARIALAADPSLSKTTCQAPSDGFNYNTNLDPNLTTGYTCILINSSPPNIKLSSVPVQGEGNPKVIHFESSTGAPITSFRVTWNGVNTTPGVMTSAQAYPNILPPSATWGANLGIVRVDMTPIPNANYDRNTMIRNGYTFFLVPATNGTSNNWPVVNQPVNQGGLLFVTCAAAPCSSTISLGGVLNSKFTMRVSAIYNSVSVTLDNLVAGGPANFVGAQALVDVTGRANDVYRRVQVRLPFDIHGLTPPYALQTGDSICKRLLGSPDGSDIDRTNVAAGDQSGACDPTN